MSLFTPMIVLLSLLIRFISASYVNVDDDAIIHLTPGNVTTTRKIAVNGSLFCGYHRADLNASFNPDYTLDATKVPKDGSFTLIGERNATISDGELFSPALNETYRRFIIKIPSRYINSNETFDAGTMNLELYYPGQTEGNIFYHNKKPLQITGRLRCHEMNPTRKVRVYGSPRRDAESLLSEQVLRNDTFTMNVVYTSTLQPTRVYRQINVAVPFYYYNEGRVGLQPFSIGSYNLEVEYPGETKLVLDDD
ncbi:unnamed protein product [Enterobius vermicularis]|uniref:Alpha-macroglobulin n=1 Tax=Enterobius vermicularis TaxID=51028 RepID=A0A0N4V469_ENTVE|nr:unnamed protein product [Enterobius vermicularis]